MKAKYVTPQVKCVKIETTHLMATSYGGYGDGRPATAPEYYFFEEDGNEDE